MASFFKKTMLYLGLGPDEEYEVYDEEPEQFDRRESVTPVPRHAGHSGAPKVAPLHEPSGSVRPIRTAPATSSHIAADDTVDPRPIQRATSGVVRPLPRATGKPHTVTPTSFNQAQNVADAYKNSQPVIMDLQDADRDLSRRLIDFASGLCYGLGGQMERLDHQVYLLTPSNVTVSAEERRRLRERGFDA